MQPFFTAIDTFLKEEGKAEAVSILVTRLRDGGLGVTLQSNDPDMCHMRSFSVKGTPAQLDEAFAGALMQSRTSTTIAIPDNAPQEAQDDLPPAAEESDGMSEEERKKRLNEEWSEARRRFALKDWENCLVFLEKASDLATQDSEKDAINKLAHNCITHLKR